MSRLNWTRREQDVAAVECPFCRADPGEWCQVISSGGWATALHGDRFDAADGKGPPARDREAILRRRWKRLLGDAVELALERGAKEPEVFVEGGSGLVVLDAARLPEDREYADRSAVIVVDVGWPECPGVCMDCGAW